MSLPRVTTIIKEAGLMPFMPDTSVAMERGTAVHYATAYSDKGTLDESTVSRNIMPYLMQWRRFLTEQKVKIKLIEQHVQDDTLGYQGTFDREVELDSDDWLFDIKTGTKSDWHGIQLAAYHHAHGKRHLKRGNLYLTETTYKLEQCKSRDDWHDFQAALRLHHRRTQWNLL